MYVIHNEAPAAAACAAGVSTPNRTFRNYEAIIKLVF
jgi:hypothetical protein